MNKYKVTMVQTTTYEIEVEAESINDIQRKVDNFALGINHTHIVDADLRDIYVEEVIQIHGETVLSDARRLKLPR
jgi:hypothetical protein